MNATPDATKKLVLHLASGGFTSEEIADGMMVLSKRTVERIRSEARRSGDVVRDEVRRLQAALSEAG